MPHPPQHSTDDLGGSDSRRRLRLATGSIYSLMALALVIIYNATRTLNFAQGEMLMVSTFVAWAAQRALGLRWRASLVVAVVTGARWRGRSSAW